MLLYVSRLEEIEMARFHALAQVIVDAEHGMEAYESYLRVAFPGFEGRKKRSEDEFKQQLKDWVDTGPLKVVPMQAPQMKSKLRTRSAKVTKDSRLGELYDRLSSRFGK